MRKVLGVLVIFLIILGVFAFFQKEKLIQVIKPPGVVSPIYHQSAVYELENLLEKNGMPVISAPISVNGTIQASISGITALFSDKKDLFTQVRSLQLVLPGLKMDSKQVKEIDLRFNKVVIRY